MWAIGAFIGEYDVPQCAAGTPVADCKHEIWGVVTPGGDNLHIAAVSMHCALNWTYGCGFVQLCKDDR